MAFSLLALAGCDFENLGPSDRFKDEFSFKFDLKPGGRVSLESFNGSVEITGWDRSNVDITGTKYASSEDLLEQVKIEAVPQGDEIRIRAIRPTGRFGNCGATFSIRLPRNVTLERIESSNGGIRVEQVEGRARLRTSNGSIRTFGLKGDLEATTSNASIELEKHDGSATLRTSNGRIRANGVKGYLDATTSNASIDGQVSAPERGRPLRLLTSNGSINFEMSGLKDNDIRCETSNASINLHLPAQVNTEVRASTSNGNITSDFEMRTRPVGKHRLEGTIGSGGTGLIELRTSNGNVRLQRR
jgi:DUF4097 and DUF4098 domain-containing protein YvlB